MEGPCQEALIGLVKSFDVYLQGYKKHRKGF